MTTNIDLGRRNMLGLFPAFAGMLAARSAASTLVVSAARSSVLVPAFGGASLLASRQAEAFAPLAVWGAAVGLWTLGAAAATFWNSLSSRSMSERDFLTRERGGIDESQGFDDPDYLDSFPISQMSAGPLTTSQRDAMSWNLGRASWNSLERPRLNRIEAALLPALFAKTGTALVPASERMNASSTVLNRVANEIGAKARICYVRECAPIDSAKMRSASNVMVVYVVPSDRGAKLSPANFDIGLAAYFDKQFAV